jgi:glutathione synthase/RimK-type ligase-like ATP-grasp enzyme
VTSNKQETTRLLREVDLPVPRQLVVSNVEEAIAGHPH